ncbi:MAG: winged helix-turn-helix transcriptional regulator [Deltaproteobacteria bacterium]|nr:winged helix-turn-helix transcriptional regulator [Deltaproteobacteria bacterium]
MANLDLTDWNYQSLAEFRYRIRFFLRFSEQAARAAGLEPQQHQVLLAVKGLPRDLKPTIGVLAERMQLAHHSTVELVDRLEERKLVVRQRDDHDRRQVLVRLTAAGEKILAELSRDHLVELSSVGPTLVEVLSRFVEKSGFSERKLRLVSKR